jgi:hypothetical protein
MYWETFYAARAFIAYVKGDLDRSALNLQIRRWVDPLYRDKMFRAWTEVRHELEELKNSYDAPQRFTINRLYRDILYQNPIELT